MWFDLAVCHVARARSVISNVLYSHPQPFDEASQRFPCCNGARNAPGCHVRSLRQPEDLTQAQISIQFALSTLVSLKKAGEAAWGGQANGEQEIEAMRLECRALWEEYEKQKRVEETQKEALLEAGKPGDAAQKRLERRREEELKVEREKREQQQRIERIAEEEKARFRHVLETINEVEIVQEKKQPRKTRQTKTKGHGRGAESGKKGRMEEEDEEEEEESEDNEQISEGDLKGVFGDLSESESEGEMEKESKARSKNTKESDEDEDDEDEPKREAPKKRIRAVESSEDEEPVPEEKRTHMEEIEKELNNVFSDEDWGVWFNKRAIYHSKKQVYV